MHMLHWVSQDGTLVFLDDRVKVFEPCQHVLHWLYVVFSIGLVKGLSAYVHGNRCVDTAKPGSNTSSADGFPSSALSEPPSKHC